MSKIEDLPLLERPREKAARYGISSLSDSELLAILLGSGYKENNVKDIASNLLSKSCGLIGVSNLTYFELIKFKGIKQSRAMTLMAIFEIHKRLEKKYGEQIERISSSNDLYQKYKSYLSDMFQEVLILVIVNRKNQPIFETTLYKGNNTNITFMYEDLYRELLVHKGKGFYLIHNHPSGNKLPSSDDIMLTSKILKESQKIKIQLLDHIVVGEDGYSSLINLLKAEL